MLRNILRTPHEWSLTAVRLGLGIVVFPHGMQKVSHMFGGYGYTASVQGMTQMLHIPIALVLLSFAAELLGSIALLVGFLGRIAAFGMAVNFIVAAVVVHQQTGFYFMNWAGQQKGEGIEYFVLLITMAIAIVIRGSGAFSIDRALTRDLPQNPS
jgi:putative oxidoreductase